MKSKPRATWTIAILITVLLSITISHDVWLFLVPTAAALVVSRVVARSMSKEGRQRRLRPGQN